MTRLLGRLLLGFLLCSLALSLTFEEVRSQDARSAAAGVGCKEWNYYGPRRPSRWAKLFPADCGKTHQSPVDIINRTPRSLPAIDLDYKPSKLTVNREHYAAQVNYDPGSSLTYGGMTYDLEEFHFHLPSEHRIANGEYVMEMHLVHQTTDGRNTAVIGVLFNAQGPDNPAFQPIVENLPPPGSEHGGTGPDINALNLLPAKRSYYKYGGSLTTPCCTEGVRWIVLANPVRVSRAQLRKFQYSQERKHNNRPVQRRIRADVRK
jgi:carbonic anhydrase